MARTRLVVSVPLIPYLLGKGLRGLLVLAFAVSMVVLAVAWPLVVWHTTKTIPRHCVTGGFGIPDCTPASTEYGHPTSFGWIMELAWWLAIYYGFRIGGKAKRDMRNARRVIAQTEAEGRQAKPQPKAGPGPRDYHLAPPVKP